MDKYEYNLKLDQMKRLCAEENYEAAAEVAESINWSKIRNVNALVKAGEVFEKAERYQQSRDILLMAYDRSPIGRMIIYRLAEVAVKMEDFEAASQYYDKFIKIAPHDNLRYVLEYHIKKAQGASYSELIPIIEEYKEQEYVEEWAYELAYMYHKTGQTEKCIDTCDELILWFGDGPYVERALELKMLYQPLTKTQEEKYRRFRQEKAGYIQFGYGNKKEKEEEKKSTIEIPPVEVNNEKFNTVNLQEEIVKGMRQILEATEKETVSYTMDTIKKITEEIPYLQIQKENSQQNLYIETDEEIDDSLKNNFQEMLGEEADGQLSIVMNERNVIEKQITGQLTIQDVLEDWEKTRRAAEAALYDAEQRRLQSAKARALQEAEDLMNRLKEIIPKLEAGVTPKELLEEEYLQGIELPQENQKDADLTQELENNCVSDPYVEQEPSEEMEIQAENIPVQQEREEEAYHSEEQEYFQDTQERQEVFQDTQEQQEVSEEEQMLQDFLAESERGGEEESLFGLNELDFMEEYEPEAVEEYESEAVEEYESEAVEEYEPEAVEEHGTEAVEEYEPEAVEESMKEFLPKNRIPPIPVSIPSSSQESFLDNLLKSIEPKKEEQESDFPKLKIPKPPLVSGLNSKFMSNIDLEYEPERHEIISSELEQLIHPTVRADTNEISQDSEISEAQEFHEDIEPELFDFEPEKLEVLEPELSDFEEPKDEKIDEQLTLANEIAENREQRQEKINPEATQRMPDWRKVDRDHYSRKKTPNRMKDSLPQDLGENEVEPIERLTSEQKSIFSYFVPVKGMEKQLCKALTGISSHMARNEAANRGNLIIQGGQGSGKTMLATSIIKVLQLNSDRPNGKVGKIEASSLNKKDITAVWQKIAGGCMIIEKAGDLSDETVASLCEIMEQDMQGTLYVLEDTSKGIRKISLKDGRLISKFTEKIVVPIFTNDELVAFARAYSNELGYEIEEMAILALYKRISSIQRLDQATTLVEIKDIVDEAIAREAKGGIKKALSILTAKRYTEDDKIVLNERHFN